MRFILPVGFLAFVVTITALNIGAGSVIRAAISMAAGA